jgi:hypothetical protein
MFTRTTVLVGAAAAVVLAALAAPAGAAQQGLRYGVPRAMPSDYAAAGVAIGREYGMPARARALPADRRGRTSDAGSHTYGMPRALPSDYARLAASQTGSRGGVDWSLGALGAASFLAALTLGLVVLLRTARRQPRPAA